MSDKYPFRELPVGARQRDPEMEIPFRAASQTAFGPVGEDGRARYSATVCLDPTRLPQGSEYEVVPRYIPSSVSLIGYRGRFLLEKATRKRSTGFPSRGSSREAGDEVKKPLLP